MVDDAAIRVRYEALDPLLDERGRRRYAAAEALAAGHGGTKDGDDSKPAQHSLPWIWERYKEGDRFLTKSALTQKN